MMDTPQSATAQALAILAVDNMKPSDECMALIHAIDRGEITHDEAIEALKKKFEQKKLTPPVNPLS